MYNEFYDLKTLPFRLNPDPEFFFGSQGHRRALSYLRYGLSQREGFIVVTGMPGTGKTTLARALLEEIGKDKIVVGELNTTHLDADDVLRMAAASFGVAHENVPKATLLTRLENFFLSKHRSGYHCLLLIDESQNLPVSSLEELRMLSNFHQGKDALLQIFLLGQQQFRDILQTPEMEQLRQRVVAATHLEPLGKDETHAYILHRLKVAGWQERPVVTSRALDMVFLLTKGVPRRINTFCDRLFLYAALEELYEVDTEAVRTVGRELMLETENPERATQIDSLQTVSASQMEYAKSELTSAFDSTMFDGDEERPVPPPSGVSLRVINGGAPVSVAATPRRDLVVVPFDENNPDIAVVAVLQTLLEGQQLSLQSLPAYMTLLLELALGRQSLTAFSKGVVKDEQCEALGDALRQCLKQQLLEKASDYYRRLAVPAAADAEAIKTHYRYLFRLFQVEQERDKQGWDSTYIRRINQAYATLRSEEGRRKYDAFLASLGKLSVDSAVDEVAAINDQSELMPSEPAEVAAVVTSQLPPVPSMVSEVQVEAATGAAGGRSKTLLGGGAVVLLLLLGGVYFLQSDLAKDVKQEIQRETSLEVAGLSSQPPVVASRTVASAQPQAKMPTVAEVAVEPEPLDLAGQPPESLPVEAEAELEPEVVAPVAKVPPEPKPEVVKPVVVEAPKPAKLKAEAKPVKPQPVSLQEVEQMIDEFRATYENGDLKNFLAIFTSDARTNDRRGVDQIAADYKALFESTSFRRFDLIGMRWNRGINQVEGTGRFRVSVVRDESSKLKVFDGDIQMALRMQDGSLKISRFDYSYK